MRKLFRAILCGLLAVSGAWAFDSTAWLQKREVLTREAERLRAAYKKHASLVTMPAEGLTIPFELFDNGAVKSVIIAAKAQFFQKSGFIWAEGVTVKTFRDDGETASEIKAERCLIDRQTKSGWAEGPAAVRQGKTTMKGSNVYFSSPESYVKVFAAAEIETRDLKDAGSANAPSHLTRLATESVGKSLRVRSRTSDMDREAGIVMFDGDVIVDYADAYTMRSDRDFVFLSNSNELTRVVALGGVTVSNETRCGSCAMATYRRRQNEIEMFSEAGGPPARLEEVENGRRVLEGSRIRFWLDSERVEVDQTAIEIEQEKGKEVKL